MASNTRTNVRRGGASPAEDWHNLLRVAGSEDEVIELVRSHIARWSPEEIARLPGDCRPGRIRDAEDVSQWAFQLATIHCSADSEDEPVLENILEFVTSASFRLSELQATGAVREPSGSRG